MPSLTVDGIDVWVDGQGPHTVVMIHGWPDTHHLWDNTVAALGAAYRSVRFTLPGFDQCQPPRGMGLADMTALIGRIVDAVSPTQGVTLLLHDWGCVFGYEFAMRHPARVARLVAVDVGDHRSRAFLGSLRTKAKLQIMAYQLWLALAWKIGGTLGTRMTRGMARALRCKSDPARISWQMNYPYAMTWLGSFGGLKQALPVRMACPVLFLYGRRKPFMFHSPQWLDNLARHAGSQSQGFATGHWVMVDDPQGFHAAVNQWLADTSNG